MSEAAGNVLTIAVLIGAAVGMVALLCACILPFTPQNLHRHLPTERARAQAAADRRTGRAPSVADNWPGDDA